MRRKVNIVPKKRGGATHNSQHLPGLPLSDQYGAPDLEVNTQAQEVPRYEANIEAEKGETIASVSNEGLRMLQTIGGKKHAEGGTPLKAQDGSFVFSDDPELALDNELILNRFGIKPTAKKNRYTYAEVSKKYVKPLMNSMKTLMDENADKISKQTAEIQVATLEYKLAELALIQEAVKGFPNGIPEIANTYLQLHGLNPDDIEGLSQQSMMGLMDQTSMPMAQDGMEISEDPFMPDKVFGVKPDDVVEVDYFNTKGKNLLPTAAIFNNLASNYRNNINANKLPALTSSDNYMVDSQTERGDWDVLGKGFRVDQRVPIEFTGMGTPGYKRMQSGGSVFDPTQGVYYRDGQIVDYNGTPAPEGVEMELEEMKDGGQPLVEQEANKARSLQKLREVLQDPKVQQELYNRTIKALQDPKNRSDKALKARGIDPDKLTRGLTPQAVAEAFLRNQEQIYAINADGGRWVSGTKHNPLPGQNYNEALATRLEELGLEQLPALDIAIGEAAFLGYNDLIQNKSSLDSTLQTTLSGFTRANIGADDVDKGALSRVSGVMANTAGAQLALYAPEVTPTEEPEKAKLKTPAAPELDPPYQPRETDWFIQDKINTGLALLNRLGIRKTQPWAPGVEPVYPDAVFMDPTQTLEQQKGQAKAMSDMIGTYADPRSASGAASKIAGDSMDAGANVLAQYNNTNVGIANQRNLMHSNIANQAVNTNANIARNLYDQTAIAEQQRINAVRQADAVLAMNINNGITNAANTRTLNSMYGDQFFINPDTGGDIDFTEKGRKLGEPDPLDQAEKDLLLFEAYKNKFPVADADIFDYIVKMRGNQQPSYPAPPAGYPGMQMKESGGQTKKLRRVIIK